MKFEDLKFVRLDHPDLFRFIPRELFEQVKNSDMNVDNIYKYGPSALSSPLTYLYALLDEGNAKVAGVLWFVVSLFEEMVYVQMLSLSKEYQTSDNIALKKSLEFIKSIEIYKTLKPKIGMATNHVRAFEKAGWKQSKKVRMEI